MYGDCDLEGVSELNGTCDWCRQSYEFMLLVIEIHQFKLSIKILPEEDPEGMLTERNTDIVNQNPARGLVGAMTHHIEGDIENLLAVWMEYMAYHFLH